MTETLFPNATIAQYTIVSKIGEGGCFAQDWHSSASGKLCVDGRRKPKLKF
ncbi:MAG TPA: hypothetical protein VFH01_03070 [Pyrinomonadaceae bacterium]|nr:hypothetical protein [Pyrinomonadaceae bacterium]